MRSKSWKLATALAAIAITVAMIPAALAQCGLPAKLIKPSAWHPQINSAQFKPADYGSDPIVGMWHAILHATSMNGGAFSADIDNSIVVWHADGTEVMNSSRPAQDGNFCLGVWARTGPHKYFLNHIPWGGNQPDPAPGSIGVVQAGAQILEQVTLSGDGQSYSGIFKLTAYNPDGSQYITFSGNISATRVTVGTKFSDLM